MITCPRCGKQNQEHYRFCLGCGYKLANVSAKPEATPESAKAGASVSVPKPADPVVKETGASEKRSDSLQSALAASKPSGQSMPAGDAAKPSPTGGASAQVGASAQASASAQVKDKDKAETTASKDTVVCPNCSTVNPKKFKFCGSCGTALGNAPAVPPAHSPTDVAAPAPAEVPAPAPTPPPPAASVKPPPPKFQLTLVMADGKPGESFPLASDFVTVGRSSGSLFERDPFLSPKHASITITGDDIVIKDEGSVNGVFVRIPVEAPQKLSPGLMFRLGQQLVRFEAMDPAPARSGGIEVFGSPDPGYIGRLDLVIGSGQTGNRYCVPPSGLQLGRESGDVLFPDDGYVSGTHCKIHADAGSVWLTDLGSSNGTFVKVQGEHKLRVGALILLGQQLFQISSTAN